MVGRDRLQGEVRIEAGEDDSDDILPTSGEEDDKRLTPTSRAGKERPRNTLYQVPSSSTPEYFRGWREAQPKNI